MKNQRNAPILLLLVLMGLLVFGVTIGSANMYKLFIPYVVRADIPPTPTFTPVPTFTPIPTATPIPAPVPVGQSIHFKGWEKDINFSGVVVRSEFQQSLTPDYGSPVSAQGKFLVVVMDIANTGLQSDSVGSYSSFAAKDTANRQFDLAGYSAQTAAQDQYNLGGVYTTIQPGFTTRTVFVFDVLPASQTFTLISLSPW